MPEKKVTGKSIVSAPPARLVERILAQPALVEAVEKLEPAVLGKLIRHVGLADAGELIALATGEQLQAILDEDLWRSERPGQQEILDGGRFALWLEVMLESGPAFTARKLGEMDEDVLAASLAELVWVLESAALLQEVAAGLEGGRGDHGLSDSALLEKAMESSLNHEFDRHWVFARDSIAWESVLPALCALDEHDPDLFGRVLERLCAVSRDSIEEQGGLYEVLNAGEELASDAAAGREARRAGEGYVPPPDARAFLQGAECADPAALLARLRAPAPAGGARSEEEDPIARAYFRDYAPKAGRAPRAVDAATAALLAMLRDSGVVPRAKLALLEGGEERADSRRGLGAALARLQSSDPALYGRRMSELSFLANVLVAGGTLKGRRYRPSEAIRAVLAACDGALAEACGDDRGRALEIVEQHSLVLLFKAGRVLERNLKSRER